MLSRNNIKNLMMATILSGSVILTACTTAKGLGPVDKFLSEKGTCGKVYEPWIKEKVADNTIKTSESETLSKDLLEARKNVEELRGKKYPPLSSLWGSNFEKDLVPIYDFLKNQNGKSFKFQEWINEKEDSGVLDGTVARQFTLETETMQKVVKALMDDKNTEDKK